MSGRDLDVVIVNWNVRDLLIACLGTVRVAMDAAGLSGEIWVVDNASSDGSVELLAEWSKEVRAIPSPVNLGFGGGNNVALRAMGFSAPAKCISVTTQPGATALALMPNSDSSSAVSAVSAQMPAFVAS